MSEQSDKIVQGFDHLAKAAELLGVDLRWYWEATAVHGVGVVAETADCEIARAAARSVT